MENTNKGKIYKIHPSKDNKLSKVELEYVGEKYTLPEKVYGDIDKYATILWNDFAKPGGRASALLVGKAGTGKTMFCKYLSNIALDKGVDVYILEGKSHNQDVINYLSLINNGIVFIDEFGKQFGWSKQDLLLSLLTDTERKRMFLFTENYMDSINEFILNRPGRIKYYFDFDILKKETIEEYCDDHKVSKDIREALLDLNANKPVFCFDHMVTIIDVAKELKVDNIDLILEILNVPALRSENVMRPEKIVHIESQLEYELMHGNVSNRGIIVVGLVTTPLGFNRDNFKEHNKDVEDVKKKFLETFKEDYRGIDINSVPDVDDSNWMKRDRISGKLKRTGSYAKIHIDSTSRVFEKCINGTLVYKDITGKYEVYFTRN